MINEYNLDPNIERTKIKKGSVVIILADDGLSVYYLLITLVLVAGAKFKFKPISLHEIGIKFTVAG
jgi:hypothetical protein